MSGHPAGTRRSLNDIDVDLLRAKFRLVLHPDPISRRSIIQGIDQLLDERLAVEPFDHTKHRCFVSKPKVVRRAEARKR